MFNNVDFSKNDTSIGYIPPKRMGFDKEIINVDELDLSKPEDIKKYIDYKFNLLENKLKEHDNDMSKYCDSIEEKLDSAHDYLHRIYMSV